MSACGHCQSKDDLIILKSRKKTITLCHKCFNKKGQSLINGHGYVENNKVNFECIKIYGGEHACGALSVDMNYDCFLNIKDINDSYIKEISNEEFIIFLNKAFDKTINTINNIINV